MVKNILVINAHWNNRGDESALRAMVDTLHERYPDINFYVQLFSERVEQFPEESYMHNLQFAFPRKRAVFELPVLYATKGKVAFISSTKEYLNIIKNMDLIIHGPGGPSIGDTYKHAELLYLMKFLAAEAAGVPYVFYAPSMGPFQDKYRNPVRRHILNRAEMITVREPMSAEYLKTLKLKKPVTVTMDSAIQKKIDEEKYGAQMAENIPLMDFMKRYPKVVGMTVTELDWQPTYKDDLTVRKKIRDSFMGLLRVLEKKGYGVVFIPQLFGVSNDRKLMQQYAEGFPNTFVLEDTYDCYFQQYLIGQLFAVIGLRYHSNIFSAKMGTPFVSVSYEQKMKGFIDNIGLNDYCIDVTALNTDILVDKFQQLENHYEEYRKKLADMKEFMVQESSMTTELLCQVIDQLGETNG